MEGTFRPSRMLVYGGEVANWEKFNQQLDNYVVATGLVNQLEKRKVAIFLNIAGEEALEICSTLKLSDTEKEKYKLVIKAFEDYCQHVVSESFKFFSRV